MSRWTLPLCSGKGKTGPLGRLCPHPGTSQSSEKGFPSGTVTCKAVLGGSAAGGAAVRRGQRVWNEAWITLPVRPSLSGTHVPHGCLLHASHPHTPAASQLPLPSPPPRLPLCYPASHALLPTQPRMLSDYSFNIQNTGKWPLP